MNLQRGRPLLLATLVLLASCGGGDGGGSPVGGGGGGGSTTTYTVGGTVSGLSGATLVLQNNGADSLTLSADGAFTFAGALASGASYAVTLATPLPVGLACSISNGSGTLSSANVTAVSVVCAASNSAGTWRSATQVDVGGETASIAPVAVGSDTAGNVITLWFNSIGGVKRLWASRHTEAAGWGTPERIDTAASTDVASPKFAMAANGNAVVHWHEVVGAPGVDYVITLWANYYTSGTGWSGATSVASYTVPRADLSRAGSIPALAIDAQGVVQIVWSQRGGDNRPFWGTRYAPNLGWTAPARLHGSNTVSFANATTATPLLAVGANGDLMLLWGQLTGVTYNVWYSRLPAGSPAWSEPAAVESWVGESVGYQLAIDGSGNAMATWVRDQALTSSAWASRYTVGAGWSAPSRIDASPSKVSSVAVAVDGAGNAIAAWHQSAAAGGGDDTMAARYTGASGWSLPTTIGPSESGSRAIGVHLGIDALGNAVAVWDQSADSLGYSIRANRYAIGTGWRAPAEAEVLASTTGSLMLGSQVTINNGGQACAVWGQFSPAQQIWARLFQP